MKFKIKVNFTLFLIIFIILHCTLYIVHLPAAQASDISLSVYPPLLQIETLPPSDLNTPLSIENKSDNDVSMQILFKPFKASDQQNGELEYLSTQETTSYPDKDILQKMQITDNNTVIHQIELGPKQKKNLQLHIGIPKGETYADYYYSIIFLSTPINKSSITENPQPTGSDNLSTAQAGIATNLLLSIGPKSAAKGYIDEFSSPVLLQSGPVDFTLKVKNAGSQVINPTGMILISNMFGQTIARLDIAPANILSNSTRALFAQNSNKNNPLNFNINAPKVIWTENFLIGPYTATLNIAMSDKGPVYTRTIHFIVAPIQVTIGLFIAITMALSLYLRIRKKLQQDK